MDLNLRRKVVVVGNAGKEISLAITTAFAEAGALVLAGSRESDAPLRALADHLPTVFPVPVDVNAPHESTQLIKQAITQFGHLDILVNIVGKAQFSEGGFLSTTDADWNRTFEITLMSTVRASRAALPHMIEQGKGVIVNVSSLNAWRPRTPVPEYSAAKAAVTNFTQALAEEFGTKGIRVNAISPGPIRTPMLTEPGGRVDTLAQARGAHRETMVERFPQRNSMTVGRFIEKEIASLVLFLSSERATMITGSDFIIETVE